MSALWRLSEFEWRVLGPLLDEPSRVRGRHRLDNTRAAAQACLYRHFKSRSRRYRSFGWNQLPKSFGITPATANRRYRAWLESGKWATFWSELQNIRRPHRETNFSVGTGRSSSGGEFPLGDLLSELERAYRFFNDRLFAEQLPEQVAILFGTSKRTRAGEFCSTRWWQGSRSLGQIGISVHVLHDPDLALAVLIHEMVHARNNELGIEDCDGRDYHNRFFRDMAMLSGLKCEQRHPRRGYQETTPDERGWQAIEAFNANREFFTWSVEPDVVS